MATKTRFLTIFDYLRKPNHNETLMSNKSNNQGRAYEFACLLTLNEKIGKIRPTIIVRNSSYDAAQKAWDTLSPEMQGIYRISSLAAVSSIFKLEPRIIEPCKDILKLIIQVDKKGEDGDVRDILIIRQEIEWEIGLSIKHNNFAAKHNRLSDKLDFGAKWYGVPCSETYWNDVRPVFDYLKKEKNKGTLFDELPDKEHDVYIPLLHAFFNEINRQSHEHPAIAGKLVEYILGKYDFYKVISVDRRSITQIQSYNLHGSLNQAANNKKAEIEIPIAALPTRIVSLDFKPGSTTTAELYLDGGWQFTFRIHNGDRRVLTSLKFDIRIIGMPTAIITLNCLWN